MPNCDFYGVRSDHEQLLDWLLREGTCEIYELGSIDERPLRQFHDSGEILSQFDRRFAMGRKPDRVYLQLYVLGAGPPFVPTRVELDPKACRGAKFRYSAKGWGLVQLYLGTETRAGVSDSHTNHNTERGLKAWAYEDSHLMEIARWDFRKITAFSSRLNRKIRKMSMARLGSFPILPGALMLWQNGQPLLPFPQKYTAEALLSDG